MLVAVYRRREARGELRRGRFPLPTIGQQRGRGCSHQAALRALAFKWIRILCRCWQDRTPSDESTYLNALKRRGSPLLKSHRREPLER